MIDKDVAEFLEQLGLSSYEQIFGDEGFETMKAVIDITEADFEAMGVKRGHRRMIMRAVARIKGVASPEPELNEPRGAITPDSPSGTSIANTPSARKDRNKQFLAFSSPNGISSATGQPSFTTSNSGLHNLPVGPATFMFSVSPTPGRQNEIEATPLPLSLPKSPSRNVTVSIAGKRPYRKKPKRDANAPQRPPSAYVMFSNRVRDEIRISKPETTFVELAKITGDRWKTLPTEEKQIYMRDAAKAHAEFVTQRDLYRQSETYKAYQQYVAMFKSKQEATGRYVPRYRRNFDQPIKKENGGDSSTVSTARTAVSAPPNVSQIEVVTVTGHDHYMSNSLASTQNQAVWTTTDPSNQSAERSHPDDAYGDNSQMEMPSSTTSVSTVLVETVPPVTTSSSSSPSLSAMTHSITTRSLAKQMLGHQTLSPAADIPIVGMIQDGTTSSVNMNETNTN